MDFLTPRPPRLQTCFDSLGSLQSRSIKKGRSRQLDSVTREHEASEARRAAFQKQMAERRAAAELAAAVEPVDATGATVTNAAAGESFEVAEPAGEPSTTSESSV